MGQVWEGWDLWDRRPVALKMLKVPQHLEKFKQEFLFLKRLSHPGLVEPYDFHYTSERVPFFTMELVEGCDLSRRDFKKDSKEFYRITIKIAEILEYLHSRGIVHGDLKPENFKLTSGVFGIKLLDLGLAEKIRSSGGEKPKGTLFYMAPEVLKKSEVDHRADLYSLGIILYELLTGRLPFEAKDPVHLITLHLEKQAIPPKELNHKIPDDLNHLVMSLLEKEPSKRISSAKKLKRKLLDLSGERKINQDKLLPLAYCSSGEMIGRAKDISTAKRILKGSIKTKGGGLFVEGDLGIGKSTFLKELKLFSQLEGILFFDSRCFEGETLPYQPIKEILFKMLPYFKNYCFSLLEEYRSELALIVPEMAQKKNAAFNYQMSSFYFKRIAKFLIKGSKAMPFGMCIDDLHWIDEGSLRILENLLERMDQGKIFLCGSFGKGSFRGNSYLKVFLGRFSQKENTKHLKLGPLGSREIKSLVKSCFRQKKAPGELVDYVNKNASGNPFFSIEVLKLLLKNKVIRFHRNQLKVDQDGLESFHIPGNVEKVWVSNLSALDEKSLGLLNLASLTRKGFDLKIIRFITGFSQREVSEILYFLQKEEFIRQTEKGTERGSWYEFSSSPLKELLYRRIPKSEKRKLHRILGEHLEERQGEKVDLAYHFTRAEDYQKGHLYSLLCAKDSSNQFAYQQTLYHLKNALDFSSKFPEEKKRSEKKIQALMVRADFWKKTGELNSALADYKSIMNLAQDYIDKKIEGEVHREMGEIYRLKHEYKKGLVCLENALSTYKELGDLYGIARTLNNMGNLHHMNSEFEKALKPYEIAIELYEKTGDKESLAVTLNNIGAVYFSTHRYGEALVYFNRSLSLHRKLRNKMETARGLNNLGAVSIQLGEYKRAIDYLLESLELNRKMGNKKEACFNLENLADAFFRKGEYKKSLKYCQEGLRLSKEIDFSQRSGQILKFMGMDHFELGEYFKSKTSFEKANEVATQIDDKGLKAEIQLNHAKLLFVLNKDSEAERDLVSAEEIIEKIEDQRSKIKSLQFEGLIKHKNGKDRNWIFPFEQALGIAKKLNAKEELLSLSLDVWGIYLDLGEFENARKYQELSEKFSKQLESDAYIPLYLFNLARRSWLEGLKDKSMDLLFRGVEKAERLRKLEILWRFHHLLAKWHMELTEYEKAYKELEKAGEILRKLSGNIKEPELKDSYLNDEKKKELLSDVKSIAGMLVGEEK